MKISPFIRFLKFSLNKLLTIPMGMVGLISTSQKTNKKTYPFLNKKKEASLTETGRLGRVICSFKADASEH
ncbi:hypothetical protein VL14_22720 [Cytobacillus firmus]|nr:hypothetical protein VL14_22720 [Cytobacillus firmus]